MSKVSIRAQGVSVSYDGQNDVLSQIDFDVKSGETFGLIGLNGAGKTTFIKILLGLLEPREGHIKVHDVPRNVALSNLVYLPEKFEPPHFLNGYEFITFSLNLFNKKIEYDAIDKAAKRLAFDVAALSRSVASYSKGMKQKVGLLATLLTDAPVVVLDEPMSGLDPRARASVKDEIQTCKAKGRTVFLSSHVLADMDEICDRICVIDQGRICFLGTPEALKKQTKEDYLERAFLRIIDQDIIKDLKLKVSK